MRTTHTHACGACNHMQTSANTHIYACTLLLLQDGITNATQREKLSKALKLPSRTPKQAYMRLRRFEPFSPVGGQTFGGREHETLRELGLSPRCQVSVCVCVCVCVCMSDVFMVDSHIDHSVEFALE